MQIDILASDPVLSEDLRAHVEQRVRFAFTRFQDRVRGVSVRLSNINHPRGGRDKHCHLLVRLRALPEILVEDTEENLYAAVDRAVDRASRTLVRELRRAPGAVDNHYPWSNE